MKFGLDEHLEWIALRRVRGGGVAKHGGGYFDGGRPLLATYLVTIALDRLAAAGMLEVGEPDDYLMGRVSLTETGMARYGELCKRQRQRDE